MARRTGKIRRKVLIRNIMLRRGVEPLIIKF